MKIPSILQLAGVAGPEETEETPARAARFVQEP